MAKRRRDTLITYLWNDPGAAVVFLERYFAAVSTFERAPEFKDYDISIKVKTKKVRNLMTGVEVEIPVNTPAHMDPSCETYWSR